jgi:Lipoprotein confined to pathogenic Mycobacterium
MTGSQRSTSLVTGLALTALIGVPTAGILGFAGAMRFSHDCAVRGAKVACGDIESLLFVLPAWALVVGLVLGGIVGGRAVATNRSTGPGIGIAVAITLLGMLETSIIPPAMLHTEEQHLAQQQAEHEHLAAAVRAAALAGPDLEAEQARYAEFHARLDAEIRAAIPGASWPVLTSTSTLLCGFGPDLQHIEASAEANIAGADGVLSEADWIAADAALRRVAGREGYHGQPLWLRDLTSAALTLEGPNGEVLRVTAASNGRQAAADFHTTRCLLPAAKKPTSRPPPMPAVSSRGVAAG